MKKIFALFFLFTIAACGGHYTPQASQNLTIPLAIAPNSENSNNALPEQFSQQVVHPASWIDELQVDRSEWIFAASSKDGDGATFLNKKIRRGTGKAIVTFQRDEYARSSNQMLSARKIVEYDCSAGTAKLLELIAYSGRNLTGSSIANDLIDKSSKYLSPGTVAEGVMETACAKAAKNR